MNTSKHDMHRIDKYVKVLENEAAIIVFAVSMAIAGVALSVVHSEWLWFSRFGSLITVAGLLLISSPSFVISNVSTVSLTKLDENTEIPVTDEEGHKLGSKILVGIIISVLGTVVWGFGDLIGQIS